MKSLARRRTTTRRERNEEKRKDRKLKKRGRNTELAQARTKRIFGLHDVEPRASEPDLLTQLTNYKYLELRQFNRTRSLFRGTQLAVRSVPTQESLQTGLYKSRCAAENKTPGGSLRGTSKLSFLPEAKKWMGSQQFADWRRSHWVTTGVSATDRFKVPTWIEETLLVLGAPQWIQ
jgi:hypothetical protein